MDYDRWGAVLYCALKLQGERSRWVWICLLFDGFGLLKERLARQGETMMLLHETVHQHGVGNGGVAKPGMPVLDG